MRVTSLRFLNFRGARELRLDFEPDLNVFIGPNGAGKSTVLDALAIMLSWCAARLKSATSNGRSVLETDIENRAAFASLDVACQVGPDAATEISWRRLQSRKGMGSSFGANGHATNLKDLAEWAARRREAAAAAPGDMTLPVLVYYPVHRAVLDIPLRIRKRHDFDLFAAYDDAFTMGANFRDFFEWFRNREDVENEAYRRTDPSQMLLFKDSQSPPVTQQFTEDPQLRAARRAIAAFLPGITAVSVRRNPLRMEVLKDGDTLRVDQMSDGEKCLLALVGDLARRLAIANPRSPDPLVETGVVLIDEIDLHLHPAWQRTVVARLTSTFPGCQFMLSTHSPQVLGEVPARAVRRLALDPTIGLVATTPHQTYGLDSSTILEETMGTPPRDVDVARRLESIFRLIDDADFGRARDEIRALKDDLAGGIPELVRAESLIAMLAPGTKSAS